MELQIKRFLLMILAGMFLSSCAGSGNHGIINVPGQDVSFNSPPANWEVTLFTSTSKTPAGGFLPIKFFTASWTKKNLSKIGITGANISGLKREGAIRAGLGSALEKEITEFRKVCGYVTYSITNETDGTLRKGTDFTAMEAEIRCIISGSDEPLKAKTVLYVLESMDYLYTLQFKAIKAFYDKDIPVFKQVLESITFTGLEK